MKTNILKECERIIQALSKTGQSTDGFKGLWSDNGIKAAIYCLPMRQRQVTVMCYYQNLTKREVSQLLGITIGTIKCIKYKAKLALRKSGYLKI